MKKMPKLIALVALFLVSLAGPLFAEDPVFKKADALDEAGQYAQARDLLLGALPSMTTSTEKADVYWRLSREYLGLGENTQDSGASNDDVIAVFQQGQDYADKAIAEDPNNSEGYFWKSGNMGKIGLVRGPLNSLGMIPNLRDLLFKTVRLKPDDLKAFYALGQLYAKAPGWPLSFGNIDYGVSLARKAVDLLTESIAKGETKNVDYGFYIELANDLYQRNWDVTHRNSEQPNKLSKYKSTSDPAEKNFYYEGSLTLKQESDREEARHILQQTVSKFRGKRGHLTERDRRQLREAQKKLADW